MSGACFPADRDREPMLKLLLGGGWWTVWYLYLHVWWLGIGWLAWYFSWVEPGAGPQGGEAAAALLLLVILGLTFATGIDALLYGSTREGSWAWRYLAIPALALVAWGVLLAIALWLANTATLVGVSLVSRRLAITGLVAILALVEAANLYALWVFRRG